MSAETREERYARIEAWDRAVTDAANETPKLRREVDGLTERVDRLEEILIRRESDHA